MQVLLDRARRDVDGRLSSSLRAAGLPQSLLFAQSPRAILERIYRAPDAPRALSKAEPKFAASVDLCEALHNPTDGPETLLEFLCANFSGLKSGLLRELLAGALLGYYFLPRVHHDEAPLGYVALLREVSRLPSSLGQRVASGVEESELYGEVAQATQHLSFACNKFAMPVGEVPSPQIEHIMQALSNLFGRIGLRDYRQEYIDEICAFMPEGVKQ
ncbi:MAG TPA: hypothetical protein VEC11_15150 [Allosphingosinicella sp.]|nr:hypothetical protein [Allosphingosinicella sp.]